MSGGGIEAVLAAHRFEGSISPLDCWSECSCGARLMIAGGFDGDGYAANYDAELAAMDAHVAAEVRTWLSEQLADEGAVFMEALGTEARKYANQRRTLHGPPVWSVTLAEMPTIATAALTAVRDHLTAEQTEEAS